jgi:hypothetical protein
MALAEPDPPAEVVASSQAPDAPLDQAPAAPLDIDSVPRPQVPALAQKTDPATASPGTLFTPDPDPTAAPTMDAALPPPETEEALLLPAPEPEPARAPARVEIEQNPATGDAPLPRAILPAPDNAPDLPLAKPLPEPEPESAPETETALAVPQTPLNVLPAPVLQPVKPIIVEDAPRTLAPDQGLPGTQGVKVGQLPKIGGDAGAQTPAADAQIVDGLPVDTPPVRRFARPFANLEGRPLFGILLRDTGEADLDRAALSQISFPVTFVIDPMLPGAAEAADIYRSGGQEVLMLATGIPAGATPGDLEQTFQSLTGILPEAVGVMDQVTGGFQNNRPLAAQVVPILVEQGRGLVTFDAGLNAADQEARRAALPSAIIFRRLDAAAENTTTIRRYLDRAAFKAAQEGRVVVLGDTLPQTIAALLEWAVEGRAASVALAPITAVMALP